MMTTYFSTENKKFLVDSNILVYSEIDDLVDLPGDALEVLEFYNSLDTNQIVVPSFVLAESNRIFVKHIHKYLGKTDSAYTKLKNRFLSMAKDFVDQNSIYYPIQNDLRSALGFYISIQDTTNTAVDFTDVFAIIVAVHNRYGFLTNDKKAYALYQKLLDQS